MRVDESDLDYATQRSSLRVCLVGSTGTIGRATLRALVTRGHRVVYFIRPGADGCGSLLPENNKALFDSAAVRFVDVSKPTSFVKDGFRGERFDAVISCMASRTGAPKDAWAIDHRAHLNLLLAAQDAGVSHFVQLSAICVQYFLNARKLSGKFREDFASGAKEAAREHF